MIKRQEWFERDSTVYSYVGGPKKKCCVCGKKFKVGEEYYVKCHRIYQKDHTVTIGRTEKRWCSECKEKL
jgi:hypothetical protein